jgi:hypothetical protein
VRYTFDDNRLITPFASLTAPDTGAGYPQFYSIGLSRNQYFTVGENHVFSMALLNQFRLSFSRTDFRALPGVANDPDLNPKFHLYRYAEHTREHVFLHDQPQLHLVVSPSEIQWRHGAGQRRDEPFI